MRRAKAGERVCERAAIDHFLGEGTSNNPPVCTSMALGLGGFIFVGDPAMSGPELANFRR